MRNFTPTVQRLIIAFTTGLFLACAAHLSGQPGGGIPVPAVGP